ncbi:MAG TPA: hypothetical protein VGO40_09780, partial [Longimicrobium sp.]|nr:hypothetical protein [Longimicrobium sp.]
MKRLVTTALLLTLALMPATAEALNGAVAPPAAGTRASAEQAFRVEFAAAATRFYDPLFTGWVHNA